ncbi:MAG: hypothetical protein WDA02_03690 [Saccharofermentanales bacterium]
MTEYINIDINDNVLPTENLSTITREIITDIINFSNIYNFTEIKTNGNIISNLMGIIPSFNRDKKSLTLILAGRIKVHLDSDMRWDDNRLIPIYNDLYIRKLKINKIKNTNCKFTILKEIKLNNYNF